jgi:hypothetical protein
MAITTFQIRRGSQSDKTNTSPGYLAQGEPYLNTTKNTLEIGTDGAGGEAVFVVLGTNTGSLTLTGNVTASNASFSNNVTIGGRLTANEYYVTTISSSVLQTSGSTRFGDTFEDTHEFTGSLKVSGSLALNTLTQNRILLVGSNGTLTDNGNLTFNQG